MFEPIRTDRLLLRPVRLDDAEHLWRRRNQAQGAEYQNHPIPYPRERAQQLIETIVRMDGPADDEWYALTIVDRDDTTTIGDLAFVQSNYGRCFEVGYIIEASEWGNGYATEAVAGLLQRLFEEGATRVAATVHPDNTASARVLEKTGFTWESRRRNSAFVDGASRDEWSYAITDESWAEWVNRPRHRPETVTLHEMNDEIADEVYDRRTHETQRAFVAPMEHTYMHALFPETVNGAPVVPWMRAVQADGEFVGFVMLALTTEHHPEPYLWRLLIDRLHQRRGIGTRVLDAVVEEARAMGDKSLVTSWGEGPGSPEPFYLKYGFVPTGELIDDEVEARYTFPG